MPANKGADEALAALRSDTSKTLGLTVGKHTGVGPGTYIPRADAQSPPEILYPAASPDKTYQIICLDLDAPFKSLPVLGPIWHWCQSGVKLSASTSTPGKLEWSEPPVVNYIGPAPPPGAAPHRYVFFLYEQPAGFDVVSHAPAKGKEVGMTPRMWFSLDEWAAKVGLGEVLAVNYFTSN
ncbi:PEBP-like protein [Apiospora rasikravindrae]|uniref:PEBP-like protein n=1 Tax=Apiospora rasikravindrae TaxID=990691 RepID=A0ABR1TCN1_9PEZI